jgi:hypothetical protein
MSDANAKLVASMEAKLHISSRGCTCTAKQPTLEELDAYDDGDLLECINCESSDASEYVFAVPCGHVCCEPCSRSARQKCMFAWCRKPIDTYVTVPFDVNTMYESRRAHNNPNKHWFFNTK